MADQRRVGGRTTDEEEEAEQGLSLPWWRKVDGLTSLVRRAKELAEEAEATTDHESNPPVIADKNARPGQSGDTQKKVKKEKRSKKEAQKDTRKSSSPFRLSLGILASLVPATGNYALAVRLQRHFQALGHSAVLLDVHAGDSRWLTREARSRGLDAFVGIHLWRAGSILSKQALPYILLIGGTDINEHVLRPDCMRDMTDAVKNARAVVAMHPQLASKFAKHWPDFAAKVQLIIPAVDILIPLPPPSPPSFNLRSSLSLAPSSVVFLLATNLRAVKDPLYLVDAFQKWRDGSGADLHLVAIGPCLDADFTKAFHKSISGLSAVHYHPAVSALHLQEAIVQSDVVVNSSKSEGLPTVLLEAMHLRRPILARNIPGNANIIAHRETGLLFGSPEEFVALATELLSSPSLVSSLTQSAASFVAATFPPGLERDRYRVLLQQSFSSRRSRL